MSVESHPPCVRELRQVLLPIPGIRTTVGFGGSGEKLVVGLTSADGEALAAVTRQVIRALKAAGKPAFVLFMGGPQRAPTTYRDARELIEGSEGVEGMGVPVAPVMSRPSTARSA